ncbi:MAG: hypothetical protein ACLP19_11375 [Xanthobacteraceae bacterium]
MESAEISSELTQVKVHAGTTRLLTLIYGPSFGSIPMMDVVALAIGLVFFVLSIAYVYACDVL